MSKTYHVAVYNRELAYGGPEEGGWWYDTGEHVRTVRITRNEDAAYEYCRRLNKRLASREFGPNAGRHKYTSVLSDGEYVAEVYEDMAPKSYPEVHPHYE